MAHIEENNLEHNVQHLRTKSKRHCTSMTRFRRTVLYVLLCAAVAQAHVRLHIFFGNIASKGWEKHARNGYGVV